MPVAALRAKRRTAIRWLSERAPLEAALGLVFASMILAGHLDAHSPAGPLLLDLAAALVAGLCRRWPTAVALAMLDILLVDQWCTPAWNTVGQVAAVIPMFSYRARGLSRLSVAFTALVVIIEATSLWLDPVVQARPLAYVVFWAVFIGVAWLLGGAFAMLRRQHAEEARRLIADQRTQLARDLHDTVAHKLTQLSLKAQAAHLTHKIDDADLAYFAKTASDCVDDLRTVVRLLRSDHDETTSWQLPTPSEVLDRETRRLTQAGFRVSRSTDGPLDGLARDQWSAFDGIAIEATNNILRHGDRTAPVQILAEIDDHTLDLAVMNRPTPETPPNHPTFGIVGMQERAKAADATLTSCRSGDLWVTHLTMPISPGESHARTP